jgi:hypothetical protein
MFCNYCGTPNPDVAKFCQQCGKSLVNSRESSVAAPPASVAAPLVDPLPFKPAVAETIRPPHITVAMLPPVSSAPHAAKPRVFRATKRTTAAVAASTFESSGTAFIVSNESERRRRDGYA